MRRAISFITAFGACAAPAAAQPLAPPAPPDPATLTLPDMTPTRDQGVIRDGWKHFYFHKAGVGYAEAYADFAECYRFLPVPGTASTYFPAFSPWSEPIVPRPMPWEPNRFGLVGGVILAIVSGPLERRNYQARLRRCLEPRGYIRYPLAEEVWEALVDRYSPRSIALQALAASGPTPPLQPVTR